MTPQAPATRHPAPRRIEALDAMRGATVAAMLLVNNPGTWSAIYAPLKHAEWHGWTPTDLIFPFFLFVVGITTELSRKDVKGIFRRGAIIIACGLLLNLFPYFRFGTLRWFGVLQRIGIVYIIAALIARYASRRAIVVIVAAILLGYWGVMSLGPLEPPEATIAAQVDRAVIPQAHIWKTARTWDPEGPLSTLPAVATALLGVLAAGLVRERDVRKLMIAGVAGIAAGWAWGLLFPINKNLWTSSYVVFTAGWACAVLALFVLGNLCTTRHPESAKRDEGSRNAKTPGISRSFAVFAAQDDGAAAQDDGAAAQDDGSVDLCRGSLVERRASARRVTRFFLIFGVNPLIAFVGTGMMTRLLGIIRIDGVTLHVLLYRTLFKPYFDPHFASLLWALAYVLVWFGILWLLYRKGLVLKV